MREGSELGAEASRREGPLPPHRALACAASWEAGPPGLLPIFQASPQHLSSRTAGTLNWGPTTGLRFARACARARANAAGAREPAPRARAFLSFLRQSGARPRGQYRSRRPRGYKKDQRLGPAGRLGALPRALQHALCICTSRTRYACFWAFHPLQSRADPALVSSTSGWTVNKGGKFQANPPVIRRETQN